MYSGHRSEGWLKPDLASVEAVVEYMHGNGLVGNLPVWTAVLSAYAYAGDAEVWHSLPTEFAVVTADTKLPQGVSKTFSRMQELGMVPNSITFMELMVAFRERDNVCNARGGVRRVFGVGIRAMTSLMHVCCM